VFASCCTCEIGSSNLKFGYCHRNTGKFVVKNDEENTTHMYSTVFSIPLAVVFFIDPKNYQPYVTVRISITKINVSLFLYFVA
jgi:hypothetical protein